jgi:hypothetical protein
MSKNEIVILYLLMLAGHVAHVLEEIWGRFWLMEAVYGMGWFLVLNWVLFCIPMVIFYFVLQEKRWAYYLGMTYAGSMILNGLGHNAATILSGRYFNGFAGGYTGIGFLILGPLLIYHLGKGLPRAARS